MNLELYTLNLSPFTQAVELQLEMKGVEFARTYPQRDFVRQGEYGAINPIRKVPTLVVDGVSVPETQVISELIEEMFPDSSLLPRDAIERSRVRLLSRIANIYLAAPLVQLLNNSWGTPSDDIEADARGMLNRGVESLEHWIEAGPYALGSERSMADCALPPALFVMTALLPDFGIDKLPDLGAKTARYFDASQKDSDIARCLDRMEQARKERATKAAR